ncbi:unnamed protein product [Callosobruchus maculatus]|uniref:Spindle assembly abnormal protein 6 N-terminal domain-containing protein n=1 Tax=Callosobruchus maculatus TaxID=64391 RepID=A0A653DBW6_CALMS|nr:unnamed protein product [Callosobruchus maculatus]
MANNKKVCVYNKRYVLPIHYRNNNIEERFLNVTVSNVNDTVEIKIRDPAEYSFNYSDEIDVNKFEVMKNSQSLDINFDEFKYNLLDMLQQFDRKEMFLKCLVSAETCTLVFYGKSKIKSIVYLTVDLHMTNQKEIFEELIAALNNIQESNDRLKKQVSQLKKSTGEKDRQIQEMNSEILKLNTYFYTSFKQIEDTLNTHLRDITKKMQFKIDAYEQKLKKLLSAVNLVKKETFLKAESSNRLMKLVESLRSENSDHSGVIHGLKHENAQLKHAKCSLERNIEDLRHMLDQEKSSNVELQRKNDQFRSDLEKASVTIAQKKASLEELKNDLVQANQLLVNYNKHCDSLAKQLQEHQVSLEEKEKAIIELIREYEQYKLVYNEENHEKLNEEMIAANRKIEDLEQRLRKANKINTLLTEKVKNNNH